MARVPKALARGITGLIAAAALAAAGPALGGGSAPIPYYAEFEYGGEISFELKREKRKVRSIQIRRMSANCEGEKAQLSFTIFGGTKLGAHRTFSVFSRDPEGRGKAVVKGQFSRDYLSAEGSARLYGSYRLTGGSGWTKCESGKQKFLATIPQ